MSLKCSIFGHRFGEPVVERDRDESGSEVVITIQEIQTCTRCGYQRIVSENKEVTTLETPDEEPATPDPDPDVPDAADDLAAVDSPGNDAPAGTDAAYDPDQDDAEIVEESPEESIVEEAEPDSPAPTEAATAEPTGEAESADDDAVILDDESEGAESAERQPGAWPEEPEDDGPEWEPPTDLGEDTPIGDLEDSGPDVEPAGEAVTVPQGTFRCPECGFTTAVESSSLREGDFCPDCHTGTLVHEPDEE